MRHRTIFSIQFFSFCLNSFLHVRYSLYIWNIRLMVQSNCEKKKKRMNEKQTFPYIRVVWYSSPIYACLMTKIIKYRYNQSWPYLYGCFDSWSTSVFQIATNPKKSYWKNWESLNGPLRIFPCKIENCLLFGSKMKNFDV